MALEPHQHAKSVFGPKYLSKTSQTNAHSTTNRYAHTYVTQGRTDSSTKRHADGQS